MASEVNSRAAPPSNDPRAVYVYHSLRSNRARFAPATMLAGLGIAALALALLALPAAFFGYFQLTDRILPGVTAAGVDLGGMTTNQAYFAVQNIPLDEKIILASDGRQTLPLNAADLGYRYNAAQVVVAAHAIGRGDTLLENVAQTVQTLGNGSPLALEPMIDPTTARLQVEALAAALNIPAKDASLELENGVLIPIAAQNGYQVDVESTLASFLAQSDTIFDQGTFTVIARPVVPRITDVTPALIEAQRLLSTPVIVAAYDPISNEFFQWTADRSQVAAWLTITPGETGPHAALDPAQVNAYLQALSAGLGGDRYLEIDPNAEPPVTAAQAGRAVWAAVHHKPTSYVVRSGDTLLRIGWNLGMPYWRIQQANPQVDPNNLWAGMTLVIPSKDDLLPLPIVANKRIVISISGQRLRAYRDGKVIRDEAISTGIDRSPTQPGVFQVQTHEPNAYASVWDLYMPTWLGIYEAWPGFMNGIHGLPLLSNGQRLWAGSLGRPASYGCIILNLDAAEWLYNWAENGVVVEIQP